MGIDQEYVDGLSPIYRDILAAFPEIEATRRAGYGTTYVILASHLTGQYSEGEIRQACESMAGVGLVKATGVHVYPTDQGEEAISLITGHPKARPRGEGPPPIEPPE